MDTITIDLSLAIKEIKKNSRSRCFRKGIITNLDVDKNIPIALIDIVRFNQNINNLFTNALKSNDKGIVPLKFQRKTKPQSA
jgi:signal transduction histidine kinase